MKYSACTWPFGSQPLERTLDALARAGCDGVELLGEPDQYPLAQVRPLLASLGLSVSSITGAAGWPRQERDLANPDPAMRSRAVAYFRQAMEWGAELGAGCIVVCPSAVGKIRPLVSAHDEWRWAVESVQALCPTARATGVRLAIEVLNRYETWIITRPEQALRFVAEVGEPEATGVLLDAYHMNLEEPSQAEAVRMAGSRLLHLHVADSNRQAVGEGHIDFGALLGALQQIAYPGWVTVECTAPGIDPFTPVKEGEYPATVAAYVRKSVAALRLLERQNGHEVNKG